jgi:hypothetical protein
MQPGYIVAVVPAAGTSAAQAEILWNIAHATFTKAMHERIATSVVTKYEADLRAEYLAGGGDLEKWPEALGGGFEPAWKVPYANAVVFGNETVNEAQSRTVIEALASERMLAVLRSDGRLKRVTGLVGNCLTVDG